MGGDTDELRSSRGKLRPRLLFYVHDDRGLGHLVRLSRIAAGLQEECACLLVTGHRQASWIVPRGCEFLRIPSLDSLLVQRAAYWGREPFIEMSAERASRFRAELLVTIVKEFSPDAIISDHLALGKRGELAAALAGSPAKKYLILRGVIDNPAKAMAEVFSKESLEMLGSMYARLLVACDTRVCDVAAEYLGAEPAVASKISHVGYVAPKFSTEERKLARQERGVAEEAVWVVCSAGGGVDGEALIDTCNALASRVAGAKFDVVYGPRSRCQRPLPAGGEDLRSWTASEQLPLWHAAADVVVSRGGYNTLMEVAAGNARMICVPLNLSDDQEQAIHSQRLLRWLPIHLSSERREELLPEMEALTRTRKQHVPASSWQEGSELSFEGVANIRRIVLEDLGLPDRRAWESQMNRAPQGPTSHGDPFETSTGPKIARCRGSSRRRNRR